MIDYDDIVGRIVAVPLRQGRRIIAIAGAPASGKSHIARQLHGRIADACVIPMDGFHRSNDDLQQHGLLARKGAPQTFDVDGLAAILADVRDTAQVMFPTFDRANDCVVVNAGRVRASDTTILVEGNYLLFDAAPWRNLGEFWDFSIFLDVPVPELRNRLVERWLTFGHDADTAVQKAEENDLPNARLVMSKSKSADLIVSQA